MVVCDGCDVRFGQFPSSSRCVQDMTARTETLSVIWVHAAFFVSATYRMHAYYLPEAACLMVSVTVSLWASWDIHSSSKC